MGANDGARPAQDDITSAVVPGANALGLQGYHATHINQAPLLNDTARMLLQLVLTHTDGTSTTISTGPKWTAANADTVFNPIGSSGAWAGHATTTIGGFPHEQIDMRQYPTGWASPGFKGGEGWSAAAEAPPFVLPLGSKSRMAARAIAVFSRKAASIKPVSVPSGPAPPPPPGPPTQCGIIDEGNTAHIGCGSTQGPHAKITAVKFASFGTVSGACGNGGTENFKKGSCDANGTLALLQKACVGKNSCTITVDTHTFGEPCHLVHKKLAWDVACDGAAQVGATACRRLCSLGCVFRPMALYRRTVPPRLAVPRPRARRRKGT